MASWAVDDAILDFQRLEAVAFAEGAEPTIGVLLGHGRPRHGPQPRGPPSEGTGLTAMPASIPFPSPHSLARLTPGRAW